MSACTGNCCAVFHWNTPPEYLRKRWEGLSAPLTESEARCKRDDLYIADMLVKLSPAEVEERMARYDFKPDVDEDFDLVAWAEKSAYTCRHWDTETKLCTAYEDRPQMCRDYPYVGSCSLDCACAHTAPTEVRTKCAAVQVKYAVQNAKRPGQGSS